MTAAPERSDRFGVYVHVPFCAVRCGYCDFNTYTATELGGGASRDEYAETALGEMRLAAAELVRRGRRVDGVTTVFFGGGTPTLLPVGDLRLLLAGIDETWGLAPGAEVTTEANPDSVGPAELADLAAAGFTRVSFGMQSAVPAVLATLDRTHDPERLPLVVEWARAAGLAVSVDLIYGAPGESVEQWRTSVEAAIALEPDHISAYALTIEPGTKMAAQVRRGQLPMPDPDDQATKYELADEAFAAAGYGWYEISNWARPGGSGGSGGLPADTAADHRCRHNLAYWRNEEWWGIGPGAHSHLGDTRFWNVKHPRPYAQRIREGRLPIAESETLDATQQEDERILLGIRLVEGLGVGPGLEDRLPALAEQGLIDGAAAAGGVARLTRRGRLLADAVVGRLVA
ncbi:coproporphyrinogen III oxidase [Pseudactinotalea sp. HY160]|uniref:radical SAM family heme chaperone HemW n=1 Tax=Pseudactinotalea sp. HY160 TaxID=2654490 RepID=UPI00128CAE13|nr:radical SAM family heme chaperone HemW [Pseudactinotalea sp. HY160]MPV49756.1 coproporphyrinogen III oxidase [Pseudactinotalea sp. HY160]